MGIGICKKKKYKSDEEIFAINMFNMSIIENKQYSKHPVDVISGHSLTMPAVLRVQ